MAADTLRERIARGVSANVVNADGFPIVSYDDATRIINAILPVVEQEIQQAREKAQAWKDEALVSLNRWHALGEALQPFASCRLGDILPITLTQQIPQKLAEKDAQIAQLREWLVAKRTAQLNAGITEHVYMLELVLAKLDALEGTDGR